MNEHLLTSAGLSENQIFGTILVVLLAVLGILIILAATRSASAGKKSAGRPAAGKKTAAPGEKKREPAALGEKKPVLMGSLAPEDRKRESAAPKTGARRDPTSIDKGYAAQHGMWVCGYCEVLNDNKLNICQACGQPRSR